MTTRRSWLKKKTSKRGLNANKNALENHKKLRPLATIPSTLLRKKRSVTSVKSRISTAIKKTTIPATASSQKTSVDLGNFCAGD